MVSAPFQAQAGIGSGGKVPLPSLGEHRPALPRRVGGELGGEELVLNDKGESVISYADYAIAMVDEAQQGRFIRQRFSVVGE